MENQLSPGQDARSRFSIADQHMLEKKSWREKNEEVRTRPGCARPKTAVDKSPGRFWPAPRSTALPDFAAVLAQKFTGRQVDDQEDGRSENAEGGAS